MNKVSSNIWFEEVERFADRSKRYDASKRFTDGRIGARANRGTMLSTEKMEALIWGLSHDNPVVRRCCLEFLDQHPSEQAIPAILQCLEDPVPRVRWHAVHALICDTCKSDTNYLAPNVLNRVRTVAASDSNAKVRSQAEYGLNKLLVDGA